jgi:Mor family transcriptional regulator
MALRKEKAEYLKMVVMHLDSPVAHGKGGIGKVLTLTETLPYYEKAYGNQEFEYHHLEDHVNRVINELYHTNPKKDIIRVIFWANVRDGHCQRSLGIKYGISQAQVSRIIKRIKLTMCKEYNKYHMTVMGEHFESKKRTHGERTKERNRQLHNEFRNGKTVRELARLYGLTTSVVYKSLQTVADQTRDYTDSENIAILMAYEDGEAVINIAKRLGKSTPAVYWKIRKGREERDLCAKN